MDRVQISACVITRDDPKLADALQSIRPWVDEIVVVTTSPDESIVAAGADVVFRYTDCNDAEGNITDFSDARNFSYSLASHKVVLWIDSDDVFEGGEHLQGVIQDAIAKATNSDGTVRDWRIVAPYHYSHDEFGACTSYQARERIISDKDRFRWDSPVHEALVPAFGQESLNVDTDKIRWIHKRTSPVSGDRNLRILRKYAKAEEAAGRRLNAKTRLYLGMELERTGDHLKAISNFHCYVEESGWDEERVLACLHLVGIWLFYPGREDDALTWAQRAIDIRPQWCEGYFAVAKVEYKLAGTAADKERHLRRAVYFAKKGLACPETHSPITTNPRDRAVNIPLMLQECYEKLGMKSERVAVLRTCVAARPDDEGLALLLHEASAQTYVGHDIVIACGMTVEAWNPETAKAGIGGSETAIIEMSRRLVVAGHRVRVFCTCPKNGLFDGVEYRSLEHIDEVKSCDLLIAWRDAAVLDYISAKAKWLWVHDTGIGQANEWNLHLADRVLALSEWHAKHLIEKADVEWEKVCVTSNGIDLTRFDKVVERNPFKVIYSSSPDRGLEQLLDAWPDVLALQPNAELHVFYGATMLERIAADNPTSPEANFLATLQQKLFEAKNVTYRGRVSQQILADEMLSAGVWVHPSTAPNGDVFTETFCIGAVEAQRAGMQVVYRPAGALPETVRNGIPITLKNLAGFIVSAFDCTDERRTTIKHAVADMTWDTVVEQWFGWMLKDVKDTPAVSATDTRPVLHMVLAPRASGGLLIDAADPKNVAHGGGCRDGFLGLSKRMPKHGYKVRAFSTFVDRRVELDGVEYIRLDEMRSYPNPDVMLAYYDTSPLVGIDKNVFRIASHHTYKPYAHFDWSDVNTAPSTRSREHLRSRYEPCGEWQTLPNGVEINVVRNPVSGRVIYHTSPDRGLYLLLGVWPEVRRRVPDATLHIVGSVVDATRIADIEGIHPVMRERAGKLRDNLAAAQEAGGVTLLGRLSRPDLDKELSEASVFAFPADVSAPCETFSVSIMECLAIGLPVVLAPCDALGGIYKGAVTMTPEPVVEHVGEFLDALVGVLLNPPDTTAGKELAAKYTFEAQADVLDSIIRQYRPEVFCKVKPLQLNGAAVSATA